jgi:hypothetical protein
MRYVLADLEGASLGTFDDAVDLLRGLDEMRCEDADVLNDLMVLKYDDAEGARVGPPIEAISLLPTTAERFGAIVGFGDASLSPAKAYEAKGGWHVASAPGKLQVA